MTLQQLQYLLEVYRTGSVSGAAKNLFLAQSSLSESISSIENELGFPIFERTKKGMMPTVQGSHVIAHAANICESYHAMLSTADIQNRHLRICAPDYPPFNEAFSTLIDRYRSHADIHFSIDSCCTADAAKRLAALELDVAILINHEPRILVVDTLLDSLGLARKQIACVPAVIQIGPGHHLYHTESITAEDFIGDLFIDNMSDPLIDNDFLKGIIRLSAERTVSVNNTNIQRTLITKGLGYTITAEAPLRTSAEGLRHIPIPGVNYVLSAVTNPKAEMHTAIKDYITLIQTAFK